MSGLAEKLAPRPLIKVCGLTRPQDARLCGELGIHLAGFIFHPQSPRRLTPEQAALLETGPAVRVGVFGPDLSPKEIRRVMAAARLDLAQLHAGQSREFCERLGPEKIIRVFWPQRYQRPEDLQAELSRFKGWARLFLLDAGSSGGGHGLALAPGLLRALTVPVPWLLAGGLNAARLAEIKTWPALAGLSGFDLNSGLETAPGQKDPRKLKAAWLAAGELKRTTND